MAEITLSQRSPLDGADTTIGTVRLREITGTAILSVAIPQGGDRKVADALKSTLKLDMPDGRMSRVAGSARAVRTTQDQLLVLIDENDALVPAKVTSALSKAGYLTVQTDSWVQCEMSGADVTSALERICPIDLAEPAFPVDAFARTTMEHLGAAIIRTGPDAFILMAASSSALSFWSALETSAHNVDG